MAPASKRLRTPSLIEVIEVQTEERINERHVFRHNSTFVDPWIALTPTIATGSNSTIREIEGIYAEETAGTVEAEVREVGSEEMDCSPIKQKRLMSEGNFFRLFFDENH